MLKKLKLFLIVIIFALASLLMGGCGGTIEETPVPPAETPVPPTETPVPPTETPVPPTETPTPTATPVPPPTVTIKEGQIGDSISISAGNEHKIILDIESFGAYEIEFTEPRGRLSHLSLGEYMYTAPVDGGLDNIIFYVTNDGGTTEIEYKFQVISIEILSPDLEVPCPSNLQCGFVVSGSSSGLTDDMRIVVFVNPLDPTIATWWSYVVDEVDEDGNWMQEVRVREDGPVFAGIDFATQVLILPVSEALLMQKSMDELPSEEKQIGKSSIVSLHTVSDRPRLMEGRYSEQVAISSPSNFSNGHLHSEPVEVTGVARVPESLEIWTIVYSPNGLFYPQNNDRCNDISPAVRTGDAWETSWNFLGGEGTLQYDIVVVMVEPESDASLFFQEYLANGCRTGDFPGLRANELPSGLREEASITVVAGDE